MRDTNIIDIDLEEENVYYVDMDLEVVGYITPPYNVETDETNE